MSNPPGLALKELSESALWHGHVPFHTCFSVCVCRRMCKDFWFPRVLRVGDSEGCLRQNIALNSVLLIKERCCYMSWPLSGCGSALYKCSLASVEGNCGWVKSQSPVIPLLDLLLMKQEWFQSLLRAKSMLGKFVFTPKCTLRRMRGRSMAKRRKQTILIFRWLFVCVAN